MLKVFALSPQLMVTPDPANLVFIPLMTETDIVGFNAFFHMINVGFHLHKFSGDYFLYAYSFAQ